jgi:hypothetical protein
MPRRAALDLNLRVRLRTDTERYHSQDLHWPHPTGCLDRERPARGGALYG